MSMELSKKEIAIIATALLCTKNESDPEHLFIRATCSRLIDRLAKLNKEVK